MLTVTVQIGNSDNKLSQNEWSHFAAAMRSNIEENVHRIHFCGGSDWDAPWQNACWVCEVDDVQIDGLVAAIRDIVSSFGQDSAAVTWGDTELVGKITTT